MSPTIDRVRQFLEAWGKLTGLPVLAVATTSLIVTSCVTLRSDTNPAGARLPKEKPRASRRGHLSQGTWVSKTH
jgi:hypothetical protein